jgi:hypothetical protein
MGSTFNGAASSMRVSAVLGNGSIVFTGPTGFAASFGEGFNGVSISDAAVGVVTVTTAISLGAGAGGGAGNGTVARVIGFGGTIGAGFEAFGRSRIRGDCDGNNCTRSTAAIAIDNPIEMISLRRRIVQSP